MKRIAIDMDETIADSLGKHIRLYNEAFGTAIEKSHFQARGFADVVPSHHLQAVGQMICHQGFFEDLDILADAPAVISDLQARYEVFITSSAMEVPSSFTAKFAWLQKHFPFIPHSHLVFCGDKSVISADYLIDDTPRHFARFQGEGILFSAPHNFGVTGWRRVESWNDVRHLFL